MTLREGTAAEAGMLPERIERVRDLCAGWVKSGHTPTLAVLVARRGVVVLHEAFGRLGPGEDSPPLRLDSIFPVSSIAKPITATAVMTLVEEGRLGLNRPVVDYIPEISGEGTGEVLVHHLLTHTSGYNEQELSAFEARRRQEGIDIGPSDATQHPRIHEALTLLYPAPLWKPPGAEMSYCNYNYELLGEIVRRVSGRSFADFVRERVLGPLGMSDSYFSVPESIWPRLVCRPPDAPFGQPFPFLADFPGLDSAVWREVPHTFGGLFSTARDLAVFGQMFLDGGTHGGVRVLSRPAVSEMTRNQIPGLEVEFMLNRRFEASYGYGWFVASNAKWRYLNGALPAQGTFSHLGLGGALLWVDPVNEIVGVYLEVLMKISSRLDLLANQDLFQDAVTAAVAD